MAWRDGADVKLPAGLAATGGYAHRTTEQGGIQGVVVLRLGKVGTRLGERRLRGENVELRRRAGRDPCLRKPQALRRLFNYFLRRRQQLGRRVERAMGVADLEID